MNKGLKSGLVLLVLGIVCGTLLAVVNSFTAPIIQLVEEGAQFDALKQFYFDIEDPDYDNLSLSDLYALEKLELNESSVTTIFTLKNKTDNSLEALGYLVIGHGFEGRIITMLIVVNSDLTLKGYTVVSHTESPGYGADIVGNDFGVATITDLSGFDSVAGTTRTSDGIYECFEVVSQRVVNDFGGGLDD